MSKVYVAIPTEEGWIHRGVASCLVQMVASGSGHAIRIDYPTDKPIDNNRNKVVKTFLESDCDTLIFMDDDNAPVKHPLPLVNLDLDVIGCPTPFIWGTRANFVKGQPFIAWNVMDWSDSKQGWKPHNETSGGLEEVDAVGTGCMVIARRVLEHPAMKHPFCREKNEDGIVVRGSDFLFCKRAKEAGFKVWAHYGYPCQHFKSIDLNQLYTFMNARDIGHANRPNMNTPEYWDEQWAKRPERILPFYDKLSSMVHGKKVLDFGCGRGDLLALLGPAAEGMDISKEGVRQCRNRGLKATVGAEPSGWWDAIVSTEVLEHIDDDKAMLEKFFEHTNEVIYTVPNNCLPPGLEPEHRRVYNPDHIKRVTPHLRDVREYGDFLMVTAGR